MLEFLYCSVDSGMTSCTNEREWNFGQQIEDGEDEEGNAPSCGPGEPHFCHKRDLGTLVRVTLSSGAIVARRLAVSWPKFKCGKSPATVTVGPSRLDKRATGM